MKAVLLSFIAAVYGQTCANLTSIDCGYAGVDMYMCAARGCCWSSARNQCVYGSLPSSVPDAPYTSVEHEQILGYLLNNVDVDGTGMMVASPSREDPDYYYDWMRDSGRTLETLVHLHAQRGRPNFTLYSNWMRWVNKAINLPTPDMHGQSPMSEPKFTVPDGQVYPGGWCRPQHDGPAARLLAVLRLYNSFNLSADMSLIETSVDFIIANIDSDTCDAWEEVRSKAFLWNHALSLRALVTAAEFVDARTGSTAKTRAWRDAAAKVERYVLQRYPARYGGSGDGTIITSSPDRGIDGIVLSALTVLDDLFRDTQWSYVRALDLTSPAVDATIGAMTSAFARIYSINAGDASRGIEGVLFGRYVDDVYYGGNPWVLITQTLAEVHYRRARIWASDPLRSMAELQAGDIAMKHVRYHIEGDGLRMDEQLDRNTGYQRSAKHLSWSYATFLAAMRERGSTVRAVRAEAAAKLRAIN